MGLVTGCSQLGVPTAVAVHSSVRQPQRGTLLTGEVERHVQLPRRILRFPCINVFFFAHRHFLFWPRVFSILVLSAPRHARREPARTPRRKCGPWPRWHCAGGSKSQVTTARHSEHVEPSRSMQTHVRGEQISDGLRMSFRILLAAITDCLPTSCLCSSARARAQVHLVLMFECSCSCSRTRARVLSSSCVLVLPT